MRLVCTLIFFIVGAQCALSANYYVSTSGNDGSGNGTQGSPWRSLRYACTQVPANQGHVINLSAGTFIENRITVPSGVSILGAGIGQTIIRSDPSYYYNPATPGFGTDRFLINLISSSQTNGNQSLKGFTLDGDGKKLHGGIYVKYRSNILLDGLRVQSTNFCGIWLWDVKDSRATNLQLKDCAWGSSAWSSATLLLANLERVEIDNINVDEGFGEGVKSLGANGSPANGKIHYLKFHDNRISVTPVGQWKTDSGGSAPNLAFELWNSNLRGVEIYNNYIDNTISLVMDQPQFAPVTGIQTVHIYDNILDMESRSNGGGYALEITLHDVEIDHNYIIKGKWGIVNWDTHGIHMTNWNIHHNVFYGIASYYPANIVLAQNTGLHNVKFYNNTVDIIGSGTTNLFSSKGGTSENIEIKNNLIINNSTSYTWYPNKLVNLENGATLANLDVANNFMFNLPLGNVAGKYTGNLSGDPKIQKSGARPTPYYLPTAGSPLIDAGINVGLPFSGSAPDIGAYESGSTVPPPTNQLPQVSITGPSNNSTHASGSPVTITANASDNDGTIGRVEFFSGTTKLGEDLTNPYSFTWNNVPAGNYTIVAKATDNKGGTTTSNPITIQVVNSNKSPTISLTSPSDNALFATGSTVTIAATAADSDGSVSKVEFFNGTTKLGEDLTSPYSFSWSNVPNGTFTLTAKATDNQNATTTSSAVSITVSSGNNPPVVTITGPANNTTFTEGDPITITANATDTNGSITKVEFFRGALKLAQDVTSPYSYLWTSATAGTYTITVTATDDQNAVTTSNAITITVNPPAVPPTVSLTSPTTNASFAAGTTITLTANAAQSNGSINKVEFFNGTTKLGEDLTAPYSFVWNNAPVGTHSLGAKATDNKNLVGNSALTQITVINANTPPTITITGPANNTVFPTNSAITITATASDSDGSVAKVEFYNGSTKIGEDLTSPYSFTWPNVPDGNYALSARAIDNVGAATTSATRSVTVNASSTPPAVNITSPSNNATFFANSSITINATASTPSGTVTKVEFFNGNTKLGEDATSPYTFVWNSVPVGSYTLTAKVTNSLGSTNTSEPVSILVSVATNPPTVTITSPSTNAVFTAGEAITLRATASDVNGTISRVEFFDGTTKLGEDLTSPYTLVWNNASVGNHLITARATDNSGSTASDEIQIFVNARNENPTAHAGEDVQISLPVRDYTINGTASDADGVITNYLWTLVSGPEDITFTQDTFGKLVITTSVAGTYVFELTVTDNGNNTGSDQITITVTPSLLSLEQIPRYFSPNNDGINDVWEWPSIELYENALLLIFNRFGQKIFETMAYQNNWDGTLNGKPLQEDAYYYIIRLANTDLKGAVRIVR